MNTIKDIIKQTSGLNAESLLQFAVKTFADKVAQATSLSAEDQVITHMLTKITTNPNIFTLDTGRLPQQTYNTIEATRQKYGVEIEILFPDREEISKMTTEKGPNLFYDSVENRKLCCYARKVVPLKRKLAALDAWICGLRSEQSVTRQDLKPVEWDEGNNLIKINPLADWSSEKVWQYIREHNIPYNPLHDKGYPSIGCAPCTRAIQPGQDIRAGRWWWENPQHKECGLHLKPENEESKKGDN